VKEKEKREREEREKHYEMITDLWLERPEEKE